MTKAVVSVSVKDAEEVKALWQAVERGVEDGTLDCAVRGRTIDDGKLAPECPEIIGNPVQMCAGCRIRVTAGVSRRPDHQDET